MMYDIYTMSHTMDIEFIWLNYPLDTTKSVQR